MKYKNFISAVSEARLSKYKYATKGKKKQLIQLYHHNIKLSQRMFGVIGMFEMYAWKIYKLICTYLEYMGYDATKALKIVEKPDSVLRALEKMNTNMNKNSGEASN